MTYPGQQQQQQQYPGYPPPQAPYPPAAPQGPYPPQAPPQGYYPPQAPPQGYYPPQAPPPPAPPRQHRTLADYLDQGGAGTKPLQWDRPNRRYVGMISRALTDADTEEGDPRSDGSVKLTLKIPLEKIQDAEYPDGEATFYCKGHDWNELKRAMNEAGAPPGTPQAGAWLDITYTHDKAVPTGRDGMPRNPRKVKTIRYTPPQGAAPAAQGNGQAGQVPEERYDAVSHPPVAQQPPWTPPAPVHNDNPPVQAQQLAQPPQVQYQQPAPPPPAQFQAPQGPPPPQVPGMAGPGAQAAVQGGQHQAPQGQQPSLSPYAQVLMKAAQGQQLTPEEQAIYAGPPQ